MIGYLRGTLSEILGDEILMVAEGTGIGYLVSVSPQMLQLTSGTEMEAYIYHHITEQGQKLFGFSTLAERSLFMTLISVNGLGPKGALSLLSIGEKTLIQAITEMDEKVITQAQGVGPKLAKKIILELSWKLVVDDTNPGAPDVAAQGNKEILESLQGMGYDKKAIQSVLASMPEDLVTLEEKTLYCIKHLAVG